MADYRDETLSEAELTWEELETEHIIRDRWIDFRRSVYRYPDGRVFGPFYSYTRQDFAVIVARTEEGRFLCVKQFRQGIRAVTTEFPAGGIEPGKSGESALEAARRELREETGYTSDCWRHLLTIPANATISDNTVSVFLADRCRKVGEQRLDETEVVGAVTLSAEEIRQRIRDGRFQQATHVMAWLLAQPLLKEADEEKT